MSIDFLNAYCGHGVFPCGHAWPRVGSTPIAASNKRRIEGFAFRGHTRARRPFKVTEAGGGFQLCLLRFVKCAVTARESRRIVSHKPGCPLIQWDRAGPDVNGGRGLMSCAPVRCPVRVHPREVHASTQRVTRSLVVLRCFTPDLGSDVITR